MAFTRTIAHLYYFRENHADLVQKKFNHFREFLYEKYFLRSDEMNEDWIKRVAAKGAVNIEKVSNIVSLYKYLSNNRLVSRDDLLSFNKAIEEFYKIAKNN